jgi:tetratricopeptide (TPR) repeat protein
MPSDTPQEPRAALRIFNPRRLDDRTLEDSFIARQEQFALIRSDILGTVSGKAPQHHLIIGQRGMGKTTLLCRIAVELRRDENRERFIPLAFPEELHVSVDRLSDFWLACLDALADALEAEQRTAVVRALDEKIADLARPGVEEPAKAEACRAAFYETLATDGRRAVLLLDNFHALLQRLKTHDYALRKVFTQPDAPLIVAASPLVPAEEGDYKAAFLDQFKVHHLYRLSLEEMQSVMRRLAEVEGRPDVARRLCSEGPRLATLRDLTGGNPRTAVLLYRHFTRGFGADPYEDLEALLDDITALYQSRIDQLSDQAQKLIALIAHHWRPITAEKLTETAALPRGSVTGQINRLLELGMVEPVSLHGTKKTGYQIAERFLNVWFLMRHSTRRARGSISALTRFLETLYTPSELRDIAAAAASETVGDASRSRYHLALAHAVRDHDGHLAAELSDHAQAGLAEIAEGIQDRLAEIIHPGEIENKFMEFAALKKKLQSLVPPGSKVGGKEFAELVLGSVLMLPGANPVDRFTFGNAPSLSAAQVDALVDACREEQTTWETMFGKSASDFVRGRLLAAQITASNQADEWSRTVCAAPTPEACSFLARVLEDDKHFSLSEEACRKAIALDPANAWPWNGLGNLLVKHLQRYPEAEEAYRKAIALNPALAWPWNNLGNLLMEYLHRYPEAEEAYRKAIALDPAFAGPWSNLGNLLMEHLHRYPEAEEACRQAIALDPAFAAPWSNLGNLLMEHLQRYPEAEEAYRKAIALDPAFAAPWNNLGILLMTHLQRYPEAEEAYRKAIALNPAYAQPWSNLGNLLNSHLQRYPEAEEAYRKAIDLDPVDAMPWKNLGRLLYQKLERYQEAESTFIEMLRLKPDDVFAWNSLGNLRQDYLSDFEGAEQAYRHAMEADLDEDCSRHNLAFLQRDIRREFIAARETLAALRRPEEWLDSQSLHEALFAAHEDNWGLCAAGLRRAFTATATATGIPDNTLYDWCRAASVLLELGFGEKLLNFLRAEQADVKLLPWYEAIAAHHAGDRRFLQNIPAEARAAAEKLYDEIERRRATLRKAWDQTSFGRNP